MSEERRKSSGIAIVIFIIVLAISSDVLLRFSIEDNVRQQARYNLQQIKYCYGRSSQKM